MEKILIKKVGNNYHIIMKVNEENKKFTLVNPSQKTFDSLKLKVEIFNKKNTEAKRKEILNIVDTKTKEKEIKNTKVKGIKKIIKKVTKKTAKKGAKKVNLDVEKDLIKQIRDSHAKGKITNDDIKGLQDLLDKVKEEKANESKVESKSSSGERYPEKYR